MLQQNRNGQHSRVDKTARNLLLAALIALLLALAFYFYLPLKKTQAPEVSFTLLDGTRISLSSMRGQPVLVNFWATSCAPCRKEIPDLAKLHREFESRGVRFIGVSMSYDRPDQVIAFKQQYQIPYALSMDLDNVISRAFAVQAIPLTLLISRSGQIVHKQHGVIKVSEIRARLAAMLAE